MDSIARPDRSATASDRHVSTTERNRAAPDRDLARVEQNLRSRLHHLGVAAADTDTTDEFVLMADAIERFETVVRAAGGDLMMDEPPRGSRPQPDAPGRGLPQRGPGEPPASYVARVDRAAELIAE